MSRFSRVGMSKCSLGGEVQPESKSDPVFLYSESQGTFWHNRVE
jgi:hypothetical protein